MQVPENRIADHKPYTNLSGESTYLSTNIAAWYGLNQPTLSILELETSPEF